MSEKHLKYLIYIWGIISLFAFVSIRYEVLFNGTLRENVEEGYWDRTKYGELYYFSMIRHFREDGLPPAKQKFEHSERQSSVEDCDILVFGDSFFEFSRHKQFPERLAEDLNEKVHFVNSDKPLEYLSSISYQDTLPKLVLFERVERYIPIAFQSEQQIPETVSKKSGGGLLEYFLGKLFYEPSEELFDVMLKRSYLSTGLYSAMATLKFDLYGKISKLTPVYYKDDEGSWLFYHDQVNGERTSFYYNFSQSQIDSICEHMGQLERELRDVYHMDLVYLPLPAKFTLHHELVTDEEYNEFLPRLYKGLDQRGLSYVPVLSDFQASDTLLYYRTDSHWNQKGIDLAYRKTMDYFESDSSRFSSLLFE